MFGPIIGLFVVLIAGSVIAQQQIPTCEQLHQMLQQGYTVQDLENMARQQGVPESLIQSYRKKCHLG